MLYMDFVLRVALSMVLGFLIGLERQLTGHPAGIRINVLICMGTSFKTAASRIQTSPWLQIQLTAGIAASRIPQRRWN